MREIICRGKRADNGEWVEGYYGCKGKNCEGYEEHCIMVSTLTNLEVSCVYPFYFTDYPVIPETVGQYTGLKDENGKKIFEGDIVSTGTAVHKIRFVNGAFVCSHRCSGFPMYGMVGTDLEYEVIGNIHDNPELLKGETNE